MKEILQNYISSLKNARLDDKEHTHRTTLQTLLESLKNRFKKTKTSEQLELFHEPNNDKNGYGAPDFLFFENGLYFGIVENKRFSEDLAKFIKSKDGKTQLAKYANLTKNIVLTNYLDFWLLEFDEREIKSKKRVKICEFDELTTLAKTKFDNAENTTTHAAYELQELFEMFFGTSPTNITNAKDFAVKLACPTKWLFEELKKCEKNEKVANIYNNFTQNIYTSFDFVEFAHSFSQTLTYALFLAKFKKELTGEKGDIEIFNIGKFLGESFGLISVISNKFSELYRTGGAQGERIKAKIDIIVKLINYTNIGEILNQFGKFNTTLALDEQNPAIYFYEHFLHEFDPEFAKKHGVYYTPSPVVSFITNATDEILKTKFDFADGLATAASSDAITLLDFACGTGAFLICAYEKALVEFGENFTKDEMHRLIRNFKGFELMAAPYIIAHLNLAITLKQRKNYELSGDERFNIILTNTLESPRQSEGTGQFDFEKEIKLANDTKTKPVLIITGNPPYSGASANEGKFETEVKEAYSRPMTQSKNPTAIIKNGKVAKEKNPKWLLDDYVKFICFAEQKFKKQPSGIFAFISNNSFLDNPTFRAFRYSLMRTFDEILLLDLHGNARKKEPDQNVFNIMQGVSINIFVKSPKFKEGELAKIYHYDVCGEAFAKRKAKFDFLRENTLKSVAWRELKPVAPMFLFVPQDESLKKSYDEFFGVSEMFEVSSVGIVTAKDSVLVAPDVQNLEKQIRECYGKFDEIFVEQVAYRPFDKRFVYYDTKKIERARYDVMQHFLLDESNVGLVCDRGTKLKDLDNIFICDKILDLHLVGAGSYVFPLYKFENENSFYNDVKVKKPNFTPEFSEFLAKRYGTNLAPEKVFGYIYAVLFHKGYREKFIDFLKADFPRVPFVKDFATFECLANLGETLAKTHLLKGKTQRFRHFADTANKNEQILNAEFKNGQIWVNESLYFENVSEFVWGYKIGGYEILGKYLKSHKGEKLDITHFEHVLTALHETIQLQNEISQISLW